MKLNYFLMLIAFAFFGFLGCNNKTEPQPPETFEFNPEFLKIGNSWTYDYYEYFNNKEKKSSETYTITETEQNYLGDVAYFYGNKKEFCYVKYNSYYFGFGKFDDFYADKYVNQPTIFKKYHIGEKWEYERTAYTTTRVINSVNVSVTVPAGTFSCIEIKETKTGPSWTLSEYYSRFYYINSEYGLIKDSTNDGISIYTYTLKSTNIK